MRITNSKNAADKCCWCYSFLLIHNIFMSFSTIDVPLWAQAVLLGACAFFFCLFLWDRRYFSFYEIAFFAVLLLICIKCYSVSGKMDMLYYVFLLFLLQECDIEQFLKTDVCIRGGITLLLFILANNGIIKNNLYAMNGALRYGCGFNNPNSFGFMVFLIYIETLVLLSKKEKFNELYIVLPCILGCVIVWNYSQTRTAIVLMICSAIVFIVYLRFYLHAAWLPLMFLLPPVLTNVFIWGFRTRIPFIMQINDAMTDRIRFYNSFLVHYPPHMFGQNVTYVSSAMAKAQGISAVVCDNVYMFLVCNLGVIAAVIWLSCLCAVAVNLSKRNEISYILFLLLICLYGIAENTMSNPMMFPAIGLVAGAVSVLIRAAEKKGGLRTIETS